MKCFRDNLQKFSDNNQSQKECCSLNLDKQANRISTEVIVNSWCSILRFNILIHRTCLWKFEAKNIYSRLTLDRNQFLTNELNKNGNLYNGFHDEARKFGVYTVHGEFNHNIWGQLDQTLKWRCPAFKTNHVTVIASIHAWARLYFTWFRTTENCVTVVCNIVISKIPHKPAIISCMHHQGCSAIKKHDKIDKATRKKCNLQRHKLKKKC